MSVKNRSNHRTLDDWNDEIAHNEWLSLRQNSTKTVFDIPPNVRNDTVNRLHQIIMAGTDNPNGPMHFHDERAIKAVHALVKLATVTTATTVAAAKILETHTATFSPKSTQPHDVEMAELMDKIYGRAKSTTADSDDEMD